jgi:hypothetical protein
VPTRDRKFPKQSRIKIGQLEAAVKHQQQELENEKKNRNCIGKLETQLVSTIPGFYL